MTPQAWCPDCAAVRRVRPPIPRLVFLAAWAIGVGLARWLTPPASAFQEVVAIATALATLGLCFHQLGRPRCVACGAPTVSLRAIRRRLARQELERLTRRAERRRAEQRSDKLGS